MSTDNPYVRMRHDYLYFLTATRYSFSHKNLEKELKTIDTDFLKDFGNIQEEYETQKNAILRDSSKSKEDKLQAAKLMLKNLHKKFHEYLSHEEMKKIGNLLFQRKIYANMSIIHSAMCLEAFINDYCVTNTSGNYFKKNIDKLDLKAKWVVIPKLIAGGEIPTDSRAFELFGRLVTIRNKLVHPKSKEIEENNESTIGRDILFPSRYVSSCYSAVCLMIAEFRKIDPDFSYLKDYEWAWKEDAEFKNLSDIRNYFSMESMFPTPEEMVEMGIDIEE